MNSKPAHLTIAVFVILVGHASSAETWLQCDFAGNIVNTQSAILEVPVIVAQPVTQIASLSNGASFFLNLSNAFAVTYHWKFNCVKIARATGYNHGLTLKLAENGSLESSGIVQTSM